MNQKVHDLLKKITYIEADIEIQKQILFSIPSNEQKEMECVLRTIAAKKDEIIVLRREIQEISPEEHEKIMLLENTIAAFKKLASEKKFKSIKGMNGIEECCISLKQGDQIHCLVKACDEDGDWTVITMKGELRQFSQNDVNETPVEISPC
jgi:hypothetical protein